MSRVVAQPSSTLTARYWSHVDKRGADECWPWTAHVKRHGHGSIWVGYDSAGQIVMDYAHRVGWMLAHGESPGDLHVRHRCDNPPCQNPAHWELGTHADNMNDMVTRGRLVNVRGSRHGKSKLTEADVREIRARFKSGENQCSIARGFGITNQNVSYIVHRVTWKHVEDAA